MGGRVFVGAAPVAAAVGDASGQLGGLYRRRSDGDGGWDTLLAGLPPRPAVRAVKVHPEDPDVVLAGTQDGPYRSTDGGDTWERTGFPVRDLAVWSLAVDPTDAAVWFCGTGPSHVYRSTDSGATWSLLAGAVLTERLEMGFPTRLIDLVVDPTDRRRIFAGVEVGGIMTSADGGETWTDCCDGLVALATEPRRQSALLSGADFEGMLDTHALAMSSARPGTMFLAVRMGIFRTDDGGRTWSDLDVGRSSPLTYCRDVIVSPTDPELLYACLSDEAVGRTGSLWRSPDCGSTWTRFDDVTPHSTLMQVAAHPTDPDEVWCATRGGEVFGTRDGGTNWEAHPLPPGGCDVYAIAVGP